MPLFFNEAFLWVISKLDPSDGVFDPGDTRPLSGANTDAKLFAAALSWAFNLVLESCADHKQRGFVKDRCMLQNVIAMETAAISLAARYRNAAILFMDFASAVP